MKKKYVTIISVVFFFLITTPIWFDALMDIIRIKIWDASKYTHTFADNELDGSCGVLYKEIMSFEPDSNNKRTVKLYVKTKLEKKDVKLISDFANCYFQKDTTVNTLKICAEYQHYFNDKLQTPSNFIIDINKHNRPTIYYTKDTSFIQIQ